jgi:predicted nuclease of predicted toxin-antitoxin system
LNERIAGFFIDECLSDKLADLAMEHGYHALAVSRMRKWRSRSDYRIARFAIDRDLVLVTNDRYDFEAIYGQFAVHPGIVFIAAGRSKLRDLRYQLAMFSLVLQELEDREPVSEAIMAVAEVGRSRQVDLRIARYAFP